MESISPGFPSFVATAFNVLLSRKASVGLVGMFTILWLASPFKDDKRETAGPTVGVLEPKIWSVPVSPIGDVRMLFIPNCIFSSPPDCGIIYYLNCSSTG